LTDVNVNQLLTIKYQPAEKLFAFTTEVKKTVFKYAEPVINFRPEEITLNDFKRQLLMLFMYSKTAPVITKADVNGDGWKIYL
jgi:hypothetical protein